jgi:HK97 family phage prohead protease
MTKTWQAGDRIECDLAFNPATMAAGENIPDGFIKGIASTPATDAYGHKVLPGAFTKSINTKGLSGPRGIKLLAGHDWHKPAGVINRLETVGQALQLEAQMNLNVSYVKDLYEVAKQNNGLSFSVGFILEDFEFVDQEKAVDNEFLIIKSGDLMEVSIVCFPACAEAEMSFIKQSPNTLAEFEKALVAEGICKSRNEANRITLAVKKSVHLFHGKTPQEAARVIEPTHPLLDVHKLRAATDLAIKARALLSSR